MRGIVHPAEGWSNLAFFVVAAILVVRYRGADRDLPVAWFPYERAVEHGLGCEAG